MIKGWIYSSTFASMNTILIGSTTSRQRWLTLEERFSNTTQLKVIDLRGHLQTSRKDGLSYLLYAKTLSNHLATSSEIMQDEY